MNKIIFLGQYIKEIEDRSLKFYLFVDRENDVFIKFLKTTDYQLKQRKTYEIIGQIEKIEGIGNVNKIISVSEIKTFKPKKNAKLIKLIRNNES